VGLNPARGYNPAAMRLVTRDGRKAEWASTWPARLGGESGAGHAPGHGHRAPHAHYNLILRADSQSGRVHLCFEYRRTSPLRPGHAHLEVICYWSSYPREL
jgi:hypothetical protein